jgi:hypothetical protein
LQHIESVKLCLKEKGKMFHGQWREMTCDVYSSVVVVDLSFCKYTESTITIRASTNAWSTPGATVMPKASFPNIRFWNVKRRVICSINHKSHINTILTAISAMVLRFLVCALGPPCPYIKLLFTYVETAHIYDIAEKAQNKTFQVTVQWIQSWPCEELLAHKSVRPSPPSSCIPVMRCHDYPMNSSASLQWGVVSNTTMQQLSKLGVKIGCTCASVRPLHNNIRFLWR